MKTRYLVVGAVLAAALAGCSSEAPEPDAEATRTINTDWSASTPEPATPQAWSLEQTCEFLYDPINSPLADLPEVAGAAAAQLTDPVSVAQIRETTEALDLAAERASDELRPTVGDLRDAWAGHVEGDIMTADVRLSLTRYLDATCGPDYVSRAG